MFTSREHAGLWIWGETTKAWGALRLHSCCFNAPLPYVPPPHFFLSPSPSLDLHLLVGRQQFEPIKVNGVKVSAGTGKWSVKVSTLYCCLTGCPAAFGLTDNRHSFKPVKLQQDGWSLRFLLSLHSFQSLWFIYFCSKQLMNLTTEALWYVFHIFLVIKFSVAKISALRFSCYCLTSSDIISPLRFHIILYKHIRTHQSMDLWEVICSWNDLIMRTLIHLSGLWIIQLDVCWLIDFWFLSLYVCVWVLVFRQLQSLRRDKQQGLIGLRQDRTCCDRTLDLCVFCASLCFCVLNPGSAADHRGPFKSHFLKGHISVWLRGRSWVLPADWVADLDVCLRTAITHTAWLTDRQEHCL